MAGQVQSQPWIPSATPPELELGSEPASARPPNLPGPPSSSAFILSKPFSQGPPVMHRWVAKTYIKASKLVESPKLLPSHFPHPLCALPGLPEGGQGSLVSNRAPSPGPSRLQYRDSRGGTVDKTPRSLCKGPGFDPWSGN